MIFPLYFICALLLGYKILSFILGLISLQYEFIIVLEGNKFEIKRLCAYFFKDTLLYLTVQILKCLKFAKVRKWKKVQLNLCVWCHLAIILRC